MRYRLRTLLIVLAVGPAIFWLAWLTVYYIARESKPDYSQQWTQTVSPLP